MREAGRGKQVNIGGVMNPGTYGLSDYGSRLRSRASPMPTYGRITSLLIPGIETGSLANYYTVTDPFREITVRAGGRTTRTNDRAPLVDSYDPR